MERFLLLLCLTLVSSSVSAQNTHWVEVQGQFTEGLGYTGEGHIWISQKVTKQVGFFFWGLGSKSWSEAVAGVTLSPASWVEIDLGAGIETDPNPWRVMGVLWLGNDKVSLLSVFEIGGSGLWYDEELNFQVSSRGNIGVGAMAQKYAGIGPRAQANLGSLPLMVWVSPIMWDPDDHGARNALVGTRFSF